MTCQNYKKVSKETKDWEKKCEYNIVICEIIYLIFSLFSSLLIDFQ